MNLPARLAASLAFVAFTAPAALADGATYSFWDQEDLQVRYQVTNQAPAPQWTYLFVEVFHSPHYEKDVVSFSVQFPQSTPVSVFGVELSPAELAELKRLKQGVLALDAGGLPPPAVAGHDAFLTVERGGKKFLASGRRGQLGGGTVGELVAVLDGIGARMFAERVGTPGEAKQLTGLRMWSRAADGRSFDLSFNSSGAASITFRGPGEEDRLNETFPVEQAQLDPLQAAFRSAEPAGLPALVSDLTCAIDGQAWEVAALETWYPYGAGNLRVRRRVGAGGMLEERTVETRETPVTGGFFVLELAWGGGGSTRVLGQAGALRPEAAGLGGLVEKLIALASTRDVPRVFQGTVSCVGSAVTVKSGADTLTIAAPAVNQVLARFPGATVRLGGDLVRTGPGQLRVTRPQFFYEGTPNVYEEAALRTQKGLLQDRMALRITGADGTRAISIRGRDMMVRDSDGVGVEKRGWVRPEVVFGRPGPASGLGAALEAGSSR